jgi:putative oxidoreductase
MQTKIPTGARLLLGLIYFVFGLNGLFNLLPSPPMPETAMGFLGGLVSSGYFLPVLAATQTMAGFLLLTGFAAPLALVILAPITGSVANYRKQES